MLFLQADQMLSINDTTPDERAHLAFNKVWAGTGSGYAYEHGTRPSTISLVVSTNPLALLTW